jgi:hypothetical protein
VVTNIIAYLEKNQKQDNLWGLGVVGCASFLSRLFLKNNISPFKRKEGEICFQGVSKSYESPERKAGNSSCVSPVRVARGLRAKRVR